MAYPVHPSRGMFEFGNVLLIAGIWHMLSCISSTLLHHRLLSLLIIYVKMPCLSIINTYSIYHHTMFFHSNVVLVHQTSERKRVIAELEGAPAKSLKNVVVPEKSDSAPLILAVQPVTQNIGPTLADCTHTSLATPLAPPHRTCTPAKGIPVSFAIAPAVPQKNPTPAKSTASPPAEDLSQLQKRPIPADWNPIPFIPSLKDNAFDVVRYYVHIFPSWEDYSEDKHHFHIFLSHLRVSAIIHGDYFPVFC